MRNIETPLICFLQRLLDPFVIVGSLLGISLLAGVDFNEYYLVLLIITFLISAQVFDEFDPFDCWRGTGTGLKIHGRDIFVRWMIVVGILLFLAYATKLSAIYSRRTLITWFLITPFLIYASHLAIGLWIRKVRSTGKTRKAVIVGANELIMELVENIKGDPYLPIEILGFFDDRVRQRTEMRGLNYLGSIEEVSKFSKNHNVSLIYIALPMTQQPRIVNLLSQLHDTTSSIYFVPDIFIFKLIQARFDELHGIPLIAVCETPFVSLNGVIKRASDIILTLCILLMIAPIMVFVAIGVKLSSPGPVIFKQRRYGLNGEEIMVYKFRTMTVMEDGDKIKQATIGDKRITKFGAFLRKTSLDELPQFFNVLRGEMSIVGPRPHAVAHNEMYRKIISSYMVRHKVKPGITGWAQVNGLRGETETVEKMQKRIECDLEYLQNWSLSLDLLIILRTVLVLVKDRNAY